MLWRCDCVSARSFLMWLLRLRRDVFWPWKTRYAYLFRTEFHYNLAFLLHVTKTSSHHSPNQMSCYHEPSTHPWTKKILRGKQHCAFIRRRINREEAWPAGQNKWNNEARKERQSNGQRQCQGRRIRGVSLAKSWQNLGGAKPYICPSIWHILQAG